MPSNILGAKAVYRDSELTSACSILLVVDKT